MGVGETRNLDDIGTTGTLEAHVGFDAGVGIGVAGGAITAYPGSIQVTVSLGGLIGSGALNWETGSILPCPSASLGVGGIVGLGPYVEAQAAGILDKEGLKLETGVSSSVVVVGASAYADKPIFSWNDVGSFFSNIGSGIYSNISRSLNTNYGAGDFPKPDYFRLSPSLSANAAIGAVGKNIGDPTINVTRDRMYGGTYKVNPDSVSNAILEAEVLLLKKDKGFVHEGQPARMKLETFPFTKYGTLNAEVIAVSSDAIPYNATQGTSDAAKETSGPLVFSVRLSIQAQSILVKGQEVRLTPGMSLQAEVKTGNRRVIEFLFDPLLKMKDEAFHER